MINGIKSGRQVEQYQGSGFTSRQRQVNIFLWREELSLLSDQVYTPTGKGCLSYGHGYVVTAA